VNLYYIWYGNWSNNTATTILTDFANNLGGSPYFAINTTYSDNNGPVSGAVQLAGSVNDNYSLGTSITAANIQTIVSNHLGGSGFPYDTNGIYLVLTSSDVTVGGDPPGYAYFCYQYCGFHVHATINSYDIKYAFVGDSDGSSSCALNCQPPLQTQHSSASPNGNPGADGMASELAHEIDEATTDPDANAWYNGSPSSGEVGDLCNWMYGSNYYTVTNGSYANMCVGTRNFLIQQDWQNTAPSGLCSTSYPAGLEQCECSGKKVCSGSCVNEQTDTHNCGSCGNVCASGQVCNYGSCFSCSSGQKLCGDGQGHYGCIPSTWQCCGDTTGCAPTHNGHSQCCAIGGGCTTRVPSGCG
jgi:hypothetical protein